MIKRLILSILFIAGLFYITLPTITSRDQIPPLPDSVKSDEPGDTTQNLNNAGYYSDHRRSFITDFYFNALRNIDPIGKIIPPLKLNYPPEDAFTYVKDQEKSTFLEEYSYPLRESIFVNGFEPLVKNGRSINQDSDFVEHKGLYYNSKAIVRLYPTSIFSRVFIYLLIWLSILGLGKIFTRIFKGLD